MKIKRLPNREFEKQLIPEIGSKIKSARMECGLSQQELAQLIGMETNVAVSYWENNKRQINAVTLWAISQITNVPITYFL